MKDDQKISTIHTLESDLAVAIQDKDYGKNIIKIVTDPNKNIKKTSEEESQKVGLSGFNPNVKIALIFGVILIISTAVFFFVLYEPGFKEEDVTVEETATTTVNKPIVKNNNLLNPEILKTADFSSLNRDGIILEVENIKKTLIDNKINPNNNIAINTNLNIINLFEKIRFSGENNLIRSFNDTYVFGLYSLPNNKFENYLLIKVDNFDLAFKSMLGWEKYIVVDLKDIFKGNNEKDKVGSSTNVTYHKQDTNGFVDKVLKNYDIRELVKNSDNTSIIYGFINNQYLLITSGESSFIDIKDRLLKENIIR